MSAAQRHAATQQHMLAIGAINELFNKVYELAAARDRLTDIGPLGPLGPQDDPIKNAETLLAYAAPLNRALCQLRAIALTAAEHRNRNDHATDICTKSALPFPRQLRRPSELGRLVINPEGEDQSPVPVAHHEAT